jgi:hypothetical protein
MARRPLDERNITRLPAPEVADNGGQGKLTYTQQGKKLVIKDWEK